MEQKTIKMRINRTDWIKITKKIIITILELMTHTHTHTGKQKTVLIDAILPEIV